MPKQPTYPFLFDECKTLSTSNLRQWGFLQPQQSITGIITWNWDNYSLGNASIKVDMLDTNPYIELDYIINESSINYKIMLVSIPSNIGKGVVWYFICPQTGKRCRKLYQAGLYFCHRSALSRGFYKKQVYSQKARSQNEEVDFLLKMSEAIDQLNTKYFKIHYAGKPTKRYLKAIRYIFN